MYYLLESNQGNHTGFNRTWEIIVNSDDKSLLLKKLESIALNSSDNYSIDELTGNIIDDCNNTQYELGVEAFEHDLVYYTIENDENMESLEQYSTGHRFGIAEAIKNYSL